MFVVGSPPVGHIPTHEPVYASCMPLNHLTMTPVSMSEESQTPIRWCIDPPSSPTRGGPATVDSLSDASCLSLHLSETLGWTDQGKCRQSSGKLRDKVTSTPPSTAAPLPRRSSPTCSARFLRIDVYSGWPFDSGAAPYAHGIPVSKAGHSMRDEE